mgnify:CR=1 FL=1
MAMFKYGTHKLEANCSKVPKILSKKESFLKKVGQSIVISHRVRLPNYLHKSKVSKEVKHTTVC